MDKSAIEYGQAPAQWDAASIAGRVAELEKQKDDLLRLCGELLRVAKCPDCDGCGFTVRETGGCDRDGENDTRERVQEQCRWCFERNGLLEEYDKRMTGEVK